MSIRQIHAIIRENGIMEYADLMDYLMDAGESAVALFEEASKRSEFLECYLASRRRRLPERIVE